MDPNETLARARDRARVILGEKVRLPRTNPETREGKIALLVAIDPNGSYRDAWRNAEGNEPLTVAELDTLLDEFRSEE